MRRAIATAAGLLALLAAALPARADVVVEETSFGSETWIRPRERIRLRLSRIPGAGDGGLAVFVGNVDFTSQFEVRGRELVFVPRDLRLPPGEHELVVYWVRSAEDWSEVARMPVRVLHRLGFERAGVDPDLDLNVENEFQGLTAELGLTTDHARSGIEMTSEFDFLATTERDRALQFNELQTGARPFDLARYRAGIGRGGASLAVGHVEVPSNRLLAQELARRGALVRYELGERADLSFAAVSGREIVGFDDFFGLSEFDSNALRTGTVGVNLVPTLGLGRFAETLGTWRLEGSVLDGQVAAERDFNTGEIVDVEESFGFDFRLKGESGGGRLRVNLEFAQSRFDNPPDPSLFQGVPVVDVEEETEEARRFDAELDLVRDRPVWGDRALTLTLGARHERVDPLFASVAALLDSDQETNEVRLRGTLGVLSVEAQQRWIEDNLDDVSSILATDTRETIVTAALPFRTFFTAPDGTEPWWAPVISYTAALVRQKADNRPTFEESGFEPSQLPDQSNSIHQIAVDWSGEPWSWTAGYRFAPAVQDNQQPGREEADFTDRTHEIQIGLRPLETLALSLVALTTEAEAEEIDLVRTTRSAMLALDWEFVRDWFFSGNYAYTDEDDTAERAPFRSLILETELAHQITFQGPGATELPMRVFVRHSHVDLSARDRLVGVVFEDDTSFVDGGVSFSF